MSKSFRKKKEDGPIYPHIVVKLVGHSSIADDIIKTCERSLQKHGIGAGEVERFRSEVQSGTYDDLLATCMRWFSVV